MTAISRAIAFVGCAATTLYAVHLKHPVVAFLYGLISVALALFICIAPEDGKDESDGTHG